MDTLSVIKRPIEPELAEMNRMLREMLFTPNLLLNQVIDHYLKTKGKQMRPILVLLSARLFGEIRQPTLYAAISIELLHNASLIHDDVVDESLLRRGRKSINALWNNKIAVLAGDFFVSSALKSGLSARCLPVLSILSDLGQELATGEIDQLEQARERLLSEEVYFRVIRQKTASLFIACMRAGAVSAGAAGESIRPLVEFGEKLGLCFQIKDDIFDYYDDPEIGKPTGNDLKEGKITLPLLYALTHGRGEENERLNRIARKDVLEEEDIQGLIEYAKKEGGIDYARNTMKRLSSEALEVLNEVPDKTIRESFRQILFYTLDRSF